MRYQRTLFLAIVLMTLFASAASAQNAMSYRFKKGDKLHYILDQKTNSTMSVAGAKVVMQVNATMSMTWQVVTIEPNGNAQVKIKVTHSKMTLDGNLGSATVDSKNKDAPTDVIGKTFSQVNMAIASMEITATMVPTGAMKDVKVSEATITAMKAIQGADDLGDLAHPDNFRDMISGIVFPTEPVSKGKSWTHKTEILSPAGKIFADNRYTLDDTIKKDGLTLDKILLKPEYKIDANPKAKMKVKSITGTGFTLFDNKAGRIVESSLQQTKTGSVTALGLTLDQVTDETTTIRLQKPSEVSAAATVESVKLGKDIAEKVAATELLETLPGVARSFTVERSYVRGITITGPARHKALAAALQANLESSLDDLGKKVTVKESVALDGKEITKLNIHWVERLQSGTATLSDGSTIAFSVKVGLKLKLEKAK